MLKSCDTSAAALKFELPSCVAVMVQDPGAVRCKVAPLTVHCPVALKIIPNPEDAVALTLKSASLKVLFASAPKVIVWLALAILNERLTSAAGAKVASPDCEAVTVQA